jgi:hypothetical protein
MDCEVLTELFLASRATLPIHGQAFETVCGPLGCHWLPETADRLADVCGQRAGRWPNHRARRQLPAYRLGRGFNQQTPFEAEFQNPDLPGGAAWRIVPTEEMIE